jgi:hypothetical protein
MPGVKETKELAKFGAGIGEGIVKSLEDGRLSIGDFMNFIGAMRDAPAAIGGITLVAAELEDLDVAEIEELVQFIKAELDLLDEDARRLTGKAIRLGLGVTDFVMDLQEVRAK